MNRLKTHVNKGDDVVVISGNHKGATGKVLEVLRKKNQVLIEGVRLIKKAVRKTQDNQEGGIVEREGPIHISNVKKTEATPKPKKATSKTKTKNKTA
ncbi:MAG: 50S ribosomal protein L24 [Opitutaceae bacterium]|nr:50S ribosomal protein L24 [Verrucomicrobiales bacterium]